MVDFARIYAHLADGSQPPPPSLTTQYGDYAIWDNEMFRPTRVAPALAYWREQLTGARPLELPRSGAAKASRRSIAVPTAFRDPLSSEIVELARSLRATPYSIALAALNVVLSDMCGVDDLVTFTTAAINRRRHSALDSVVGFFMNPMPIRVRTSGDPTFAELVERGAATIRQALTHEAPGMLVFDEKSPCDSPLGRVMLNFVDAPAPRAQGASGMQITPLPLKVPKDRKSALAWVVERNAERLHGTLIGGADWFDEATVAQTAATLMDVLERGVRAPRTPLSRLFVPRQELR
jgi:non-ribosomal peptide synthetase component F